MTQQEVAEVIGVARSAITRIESGERSVSTLELASFAELYRRSVADFFSESSLDDDAALVLFRSYPDLEEDHVRDEVSRQLALCREGMELERLLGWNETNTPPQYELVRPLKAYKAVEQGLWIAEQERKRLGLGDQPISDMSDLISRQGIWATGARLPDEVSGIFLHHRSVGMAIIVNFEHRRARKRFSYAHEYGHALMDRDRNVTVSSTQNTGDMEEKRANAFAAAFLMPETGVSAFLKRWRKGLKSRQFHSFYDVATEQMRFEAQRNVSSVGDITYQDVAIVASHFGTSYPAAAYRLKSIIGLSQKQCETLIQKEDLGRQFWSILGLERDAEPRFGQPDRELVGQVARLAIEAYRQEEISKGKLLELAKKLRIPASQLMDLAEGA